MNHFVGAACSGIMPGGEQTELPLLSKDGQAKLRAPYLDWAPQPWSELPPRPTNLGPVPGDSPPPFVRLILLVSGMDGIVATLQGRATIERSFKSMKSKVIPLRCVDFLRMRF